MIKNSLAVRLDQKKKIIFIYYQQIIAILIFDSIYCCEYIIL